MKAEAIKLMQLKKALQAASVTELKRILQADQRSIKNPVSPEDAKFVKEVYPLLKAGLPLQDAIAQVKGEEEEELPPENNSSNHQQKQQTRTQGGNNYSKQMQAQTLRTKVVEDATDFQEAYWRLMPVAMNSQQVVESTRVQNAIASFQDTVLGEGETPQSQGDFLNQCLEEFDQLLPALPGGTQKLLAPSSSTKRAA